MIVTGIFITNFLNKKLHNFDNGDFKKIELPLQTSHINHKIHTI
ncbi:hypothetical protein NEIMUCOT_05117 [Neisseria mucosa ATCC 25996]|uniref:Uncharacterized protein n=1 Tax=Neisseria mucosa (strain ATCC 25996 / DSM 4631 / NCTC 10774 / M26) TaxID=546266 RepID=D2ZWW9_NEIM2|nr:hypothetical protein NEIMUCOT_05117 [Neisseria mucosa ATCC 25996]